MGKWHLITLKDYTSINIVVTKFCSEHYSEEDNWSGGDSRARKKKKRSGRDDEGDGEKTRFNGEIGVFNSVKTLHRVNDVAYFDRLEKGLGIILRQVISVLNL